jgi:hypothetical protein
MKNRIIALVVGMILLLVASLVAQAPDTIIIDDGNEGICYYGSKYVAQKFSPGVSCTLNAVILKIPDPGLPCSLFVWPDSSGIPRSSSDLITPIDFVSSAPGWQRIDISTPIVLSEDFWIGVYFSEYVIYSDNTPNCHNRIADSYDKIDWWLEDYHRYGELLLRPIVSLLGSRHDLSCTEISSRRGYFLPNPAFDTVDVIVKNFGSVTEIDIPVYLRVTDTLGMLVFFDVKYIDTLMHNENDTISFPWTFDQDCDCFIEGYAWISNDCIRDNDKSVIESYIRTYPAELYYDNIYATWRGWHIDSVANKYIPPYYPCKIDSIKLAFDAWPTGTTYTFGIAAIILDEDTSGYPGIEIAKDSVLGLGQGTYWWFIMDFRKHNVTIDSGGFFVEWTSIPDSTTPSHEPSIWIEDGNPPFATMSWYKYNGVWYHCLEYLYPWLMRADPMIRVWVDFPSAVFETKDRQSLKNGLSISPTISNGKIECSFCIEKQGKVDISCYGIDGRKIKSLLRAQVKKGLHYIYPDLSKLPQGVYFIRMEGEGFSDSKKVILLR